MVFDTERFIVEVQNRPCIWNSNADDYNNREVRLRAWEDIADCLYDDWMDLHEDIKTARIREVQKKWKGLRDYFNREKTKKGSNNIRNKSSRKRKAPFLNLLQFLKGTKHTQSSKHNPIWVPAASGPPAGDSEERPLTLARKSTKMTVIEDASLRSMENKDLDPDMNFLLNILPDMKSMTPRQNFEFRFGIMKLIKDIKYDQVDNFCYDNTPGTSYHENESASRPTYVSIPVECSYVNNTNTDDASSIQSSPYASPGHQNDMLDIHVDIKCSPLIHELDDSSVEEKPAMSGSPDDRSD